MTDGTGKVVLITGSRKGVGKALANHFLGAGAQVIGLSREAATIEHASYTHHLCDVSKADEVRAVFQKVASQSGLDVLINNAGVLNSQHSLMLAPSSAEEMLMTNLLGPFLVSREAAKLLKNSQAGRIVNIGSMAAVLEPSGDSVYAACKSGLVTMTNVLAKEFASFGITCNTIGVTAIETDMMAQINSEKLSAIVADLPLPRYACDDDIFNVVDFFTSARSSYITAQTIYLGGIHG